MARSKDEADFVGPLQLLVVGTLGYALWLVWQKRKEAQAAALQSGQGGLG